MQDAMKALKLLYVKCFESFGYDFFIRKRVEKRMWAVIGAHLKALETQAVREKFSNSV